MDELAEDGPAPVWVLSSYRAGENRQICGLATRLRLPWVVKHLRYRAIAGTLGLLRRVTAGGIDGALSDPLKPPWPHLVISAGLRNEPVARWIRAQSGGQTRVVFLGRTWMPIDKLDLLVTTPQYRIGQHPRVHHNLLTLHDVTPHRLAAAREKWEPRFAHLPQPRVGALIGGNSGPYAFGAATARRLAETLDALRSGSGGSVLVTTSARTPAIVAHVLENELEEPVLVHRWRPGDPDNPYMGILACADELVVTADSVAMLSEAAATGSPTRIFPLPPGGEGDGNLKARVYRLVTRWGPQRASRDVGLFHRSYVASGYGTMLGLSSRAAAPARRSCSGPVEDETNHTVERVLGLMEDDERRAAGSNAPRQSSTR